MNSESNPQNDWPPLTLPPASGLCLECISNKERTYTNGVIVVSYCAHTSSGGIMPVINGVPSGRWTILTPIEVEDFIAYIHTLDARVTELAKQLAKTRMNN